MATLQICGSPSSCKAVKLSLPLTLLTACQTANKKEQQCASIKIQTTNFQPELRGHWHRSPTEFGCDLKFARPVTAGTMAYSWHPETQGKQIKKLHTNSGSQIHRKGSRAKLLDYVRFHTTAHDFTQFHTCIPAA